MEQSKEISERRDRAVEATPRCLSIFGQEGGVRNSQQFIRGFSALMADLAAGRIADGRANAISNAGAKLLKAAELEQRFGIGCDGTNRKNLEFTRED